MLVAAVYFGRVWYPQKDTDPVFRQEVAGLAVPVVVLLVAAAALVAAKVPFAGSVVVLAA